MYCGPCEILHEERSQKHAEYWCSCCEEGLCGECQQHHKAIKSIRNHKIIPIAKYKEHKDTLSAYSAICEKHELTLDLYCPNHEAACCFKCVSREHDRCVGLTSLSQFLKSFSESPLQTRLEREIDTFSENCNRVIQNRKDAKQTVPNQIETIKADISKVRSEINGLLDKIENDTVAKANSVLEEHCTEIDEAIRNLEEKKKLVNDMKIKYETLLENGNDFQIFKCSKEIEQMVCEEKNALIAMVNGVENTEVRISTDASYKDSLLKLFEVNVSKTKCSVCLDECDQSVGIAQIVSKESAIEQITLTPYKKINLSLEEEGNISSVVLIENDEMIIANHNSKSLIIHNLKNGENKTFSFSEKPFGITVIDAERIAVSSPFKMSIMFLKLNNMSIQKEIYIENQPWGISFETDMFLVALRNKYAELQLRDLSDSPVKRIAISTFNQIYVCRANDLNFVSNFNKGTIECFNDLGNKVWELQNEQLLGARNMCADHHGNLFVACTDINSILVVSMDGKHFKTLLNFPEPKSICLDNTNSILYVCSFKGDRFESYQISYA